MQRLFNDLYSNTPVWFKRFRAWCAIMWMGCFFVWFFTKDNFFGLPPEHATTIKEWATYGILFFGFFSVDYIAKKWRSIRKLVHEISKDPENEKD